MTLKKKKPKTDDINYLPKHLQGLPQNRWRGFKTRHIRPWRQNTFGPANAGRVYSDEEKQAWIAANLG